MLCLSLLQVMVAGWSGCGKCAGRRMLVDAMMRVRVMLVIGLGQHTIRLGLELERPINGQLRSHCLVLASTFKQGLSVCVCGGGKE